MTDAGRLIGRRILLSGGSSGIGEASARAFADHGASVVFLDIDDERGKSIETAPSSRTGTLHFIQCDVADQDAVIDATATAVDRLGGLDVVVAAAGIEGAADAATVSSAELSRMIDINVMGTVWLNQAAFPSLREAGGGAIINFGSSAGIVGSPEMPHYSLSKGAVLAWTRAIAQAWMPHGIRANVVVPAIWTPMYDGRRARFRDDEEMAAHDRRRATSMLGGRLGDPDRDMAPVMVFLASQDAAFITGQTIAVNGGSLIVT